MHKELYRFHLLQADETMVMVSKDGRPGRIRISFFRVPSTCETIFSDALKTLPKAAQKTQRIPLYMRR